MAVRRLLCLAGALLLAGPLLRSETIYSNFGELAPNGAGGGWILGHGMLAMSGPFAIAVPFVPQADYLLDTIRIPLTGHSPGSQDQFTVEIRDGATQPGAVLERYSRSLTGFSLMELDSSMHPVLYSGRQYWVVVSTSGWGEWGWGATPLSGTMLYRLTQDSVWVPPGISSGPLGLFVAGTPTTVRAPSTNFENGASVPHVVSGGGWQTTFLLVNTGPNPASANLNFFDDSGSPLSMPLVYPQSGRSVTASSISEQIAGGGSITVIASDAGPAQEGYATFTTNGEAGALTILRYNPTGQELGLPVETRNANSYLLAYDHTGEIQTCIGIANLSAIPVSVPLTIRDQNGSVLVNTTISLPANGHTSFDLTDRYGITAGKQGIIQLDTPEFARISVIGLRTAPATGSLGGFSLATIPVVAR